MYKIEKPADQFLLLNSLHKFTPFIIISLCYASYGKVV